MIRMTYAELSSLLEGTIRQYLAEYCGSLNDDDLRKLIVVECREFSEPRRAEIECALQDYCATGQGLPEPSDLELTLVLWMRLRHAQKLVANEPNQQTPVCGDLAQSLHYYLIEWWRECEDQFWTWCEDRVED